MPRKRRGRPTKAAQPSKKAKTTKKESGKETSDENVTYDQNGPLKVLPEIFTVPPPQPKGRRKPGQLTPKQLKQYFEEVGIKD